MSKGDSQFICLLVILIDSVFRAGKNCYPQVILQEFKYIIEEKDFLLYYCWCRKSWWRKLCWKNSDREDSSEEGSD